MRLLSFAVVPALCIFSITALFAQSATIPIETKDFSLVMQTDAKNRLWHVYFGQKLHDKKEYELLGKQYFFSDANAGLYNNAYTPAGTWNLNEPALRVTHADGNPSTELLYQSHEVQTQQEATLTKVVLKDPVYGTQVHLFFKVWPQENLVEQWTEITNGEKGTITMNKYASANLFFAQEHIYLTSFQGEYLKEMQPMEEKLQQGIKSVESKLGTRAMLLGTPNFMLSFGKPAEENEGMVMLGQLAWSANFKLDFEIDSYKNLRLIAGINPFASDYTLGPGATFKTPSLIYTISDKGTGQASRQMQNWAKKYRIMQGDGDRLTLLNNWEATYFDFNETKLSGLIKDTKTMGLDLFLLDDGWFGNKHPRNNDDAGLGDWQENVKKLPNGLGYLVKEAENNGVKFGIWIEPEMVNPRSELYEKHPDWVIKQPQRPEKLYRNQLVLDLTNPKVQDFVFGIVDSLFIKNPKIAFVKWDCNAVIYNAFSASLEASKTPQTHLYVDYVKGLYSVLKRIRGKYPSVAMMLCSGGGGRADYELLQYFTEFWPSDNTEPVERIFLQWNYSYFFPAIAMDCHVTNWGKQPLKFKVDVASMGKLGFDIVASHLNEQELVFVKQAIQNYNNFKPLILHGTQYRLASPYENPYASMMYVNDARTQAIMFTCLHSNRFSEKATIRPIKLNGLDPAKKYALKEINLFAGAKTTLNESEVYTGEYLMRAGINPDVHGGRASVVLIINEVK